MIDIERLKNDISIVDLVSSEYTVAGRGHTLTTVEHDSLKLFTRNNSWAWYSRSGAGGAALGGSVIDWYMHQYGMAYSDAIKQLDESLNGGWVKPISECPVMSTAAKHKRKEWNVFNANTKADVAHKKLMTEPNNAGRDYLSSRGIKSDVCKFYNIGYDPQVYYGKTDDGEWLTGEAIVLPYYNDSGDVIGIRYRWLNPLPGQSKSFAAAGSQFSSAEFGLHQTSMLNEVGSSTLFVVEGEFNAASIRQCGYDAVSPGSESAVLTQALIEMSSRYYFVVCWSDQTKYALNNAEAIDGQPLTRLKDNMDANDLLQSGEGELERYIESILH